MGSTAKSWIILRCAGRVTLPLARSLAEDGFEVWTPSELLRPRGRRGKLRTPILPTFVFANSLSLWTLVALSEDPLCKHGGFSVMRHCGGRGYPEIADVELEPLRSEERRVVPASQRPVFQRDETVRLPEGPFAGMSGIVESADHKHAWVRFGGFARPVKIATFLLRSNSAITDPNAERAPRHRNAAKYLEQHAQVGKALSEKCEACNDDAGQGAVRAAPRP